MKSCFINMTGKQENKHLCPECVKPLQMIKEAPSLVWTCDNCGYSIATTYTEAIYKDETIYSIFLLNLENNLNTIKSISKFTCMNFIQAKKYLETSTEIEIFKGYAYEIQKKKVDLYKENIEYKIVPDFPY